MVARNRYHRFEQAPLNRNPAGHRLTERLRHYFEQHPEVSREDFLLGAIQREMDSRSPGIVGTWPESARPQRRETSRSDVRWSRTADNTHIHAWLAQRVLLLDRRRNSWREKVRRVLSRSPLVRWFRRHVGLVANAQSPKYVS